jgi:hypothetical protein
VVSGVGTFVWGKVGGRGLRELAGGWYDDTATLTIGEGGVEMERRAVEKRKGRKKRSQPVHAHT